MSLPVHSPLAWLTLLARAARTVLPESYQTRWVRAQGTRGPRCPDAGPLRARAPPLRALCQFPTHRGASLTFRYCCGSSLSCGGATGRSGRGSVSSACQGLCVPSFYGVPRACPLKRITRLAVNLGGWRGRGEGHTIRTRHSGPHTPLMAYRSQPTERQRLQEPNQGATCCGLVTRLARAAGYGWGAHSLGVAASLQLHQLSLLLLVPPLDLGQPHPEVQLHGIHAFQGGLHGIHLRGERGEDADAHQLPLPD